MPGVRRIQKESVSDLELPCDTTLKTAVIKLGFKDDEIEHLRIFVNNKLASIHKVLKDGDYIWVGIIMGGG